MIEYRGRGVVTSCPHRKGRKRFCVESHVDYTWSESGLRTSVVLSRPLNGPTYLPTCDCSGWRSRHNGTKGVLTWRFYSWPKSGESMEEEGTGRPRGGPIRTVWVLGCLRIYQFIFSFRTTYLLITLTLLTRAIRRNFPSVMSVVD